MKRPQFLFLCITGLLFTMQPGALSLPQQVNRPEWAVVRRVLDGDTYEVLANYQVYRVRLLGVDAPETGQPGGRLATDSVARLLRGRMVQLVRGGTDLYGRTLGTLWLVKLDGNGHPRRVAVDSVLVVRGWAWAFDPTHTVAGRAAQQQQAQAARRGLWKCGLTGPVAPKVWRGYDRKTKLRYWVNCPW